MKALALALLLAVLPLDPGRAANPSETLDDPRLEERARELSKELRCLVCQNQSIDDSDADLAKDLRVLVRERLVAGDSDQEVLTYLTDRYGAFVRLRPPFALSTLMLWLAPALAFALAAGGFLFYLRERRRAAATPEPSAARLSAAEEARLDALLRARSER